MGIRLLSFVSICSPAECIPDDRLCAAQAWKKLWLPAGVQRQGGMVLDSYLVEVNTWSECVTVNQYNHPVEETCLAGAQWYSHKIDEGKCGSSFLAENVFRISINFGHI